MGQDFGIPEQDLREMDADRLADTLRHMQRLALSDRSAERTVLGALEQQQSAPPAGPGGSASGGLSGSTTPSAAPAALLSDEQFAALTSDTYRPEMQALARAVRQIGDRLGTLDTRVGQVSGHLQQQQQTQLQNEADSWFAKRPEYGKGGRAALGRGSPDLLRRMALLNVAKGFTGSLSEQMEQAHQVLYPAAPAAAPVPAQATGSAAGAPQAGEWAAAGAARPTQRSGAAEPNGVAKAVQSVERLMTEQRQQGQAVTLDDFPG